MKKINSLALSFAVLLVAVLVFGFAELAWSWTNPSGNPPTGGGALYYSGGKIGMGQAPGNAKLHINSNGMASSDYNIFSEYNSKVLFALNNDGNIGMGIFPGGAKLDIADAGTPSGFPFLRVGDDAFLTDIDQANTLAIYGNQDKNQASVKLGAGGASLYGGANGNLGIGQSPGNAKLHINSNGMSGGTGDYNLFTEYGGNVLLVVKNNGNAGLETLNPNSSKGTGGYLDVKDVYLRDAGKWASAVGGGDSGNFGGMYRLRNDESIRGGRCAAANPKTGSCSCPSGFNTSDVFSGELLAGWYTWVAYCWK